MLCTFVNCARLSYRHWQWRNGDSKTPPFLHFPIVKAGAKTIGHLPIAEGLSFRSLDRHIYDYKLRKKKKDLVQECSEFSPPTSKLVANWQY
jgi:hypothetical protein